MRVFFCIVILAILSAFIVKADTITVPVTVTVISANPLEQDCEETILDDGSIEYRC